MEIQTIDDIKNLIKSDTETDTIEFKKTTGQLERGMETLCAFLNGDGGTVLFGVTDEGKIIGQDIAGKTKETIGEAISRIEPNVNVRIFMYLCLIAKRKSLLYMWRVREWNVHSVIRDDRICVFKMLPR